MNPDLEAQAAAKGDWYRKLQSSQAELAEEMAGIKAWFEENFEPGWKMDLDGVTMSVREGNRKFDPTLAIAHLTADEKKACIETRLNEKKLRALIEGKGVIDSCMVPNPKAKPVVQLG